MGIIVYSDVRVLVNKKPYLIHNVPATYGPVESYFLDKNSAGLLYTPLEGERSSGRYTISALIDMYFNKIDFTFDSNDQLREIERYLGIYIAILEQEEHFANREQKEYLNRARALFKFLHMKVENLNKKQQKSKINQNPFLNAVTNYKN